MADAGGTKSGGGGGDGGRPAPEALVPPRPPVRWKHVWPLPALVIAAGMLGSGVYMALKSRPKPPPGTALEEAKALVEERRFAEAIDRLASAEVRQYLDFGESGKGAGKPQRQAFYLARARAFAGEQAGRGLSIAANHQSIVEDYLKAEELGLELEPADVHTLVGSLLALDKVDDALKRIEGLPEAERERKTRLTRMVVEHNLEAGAAAAAAGMGLSEPERRRSDRTLELLATLSSDPSLTPADKAWVLTRQAEMLIATGPSGAEEAAGKLVRRIGLLKDVPGDQQGELYLLLGKAYFQSDQPQAALKQLEAADAILDKSSPLRAELGVMLGRLAQSGVTGELGKTEAAGGARALEVARERFEGVMKDWAGVRGRVQARALLGLAEVEASLRNDTASLEKYAELIDLVKQAAAAKGAAAGRSTGDVTRETVLASLLRRYQERFDSGQRESALRFAETAETLFPGPGGGETPAEVLGAIGTARRALGDAVLTQAAGGVGPAAPDAALPPEGIAGLDASTKAEAKRNYMVAAEYLRRHARALQATDPGAAAQSLWTAADSYDRAGDLDEAQKAFADYADGASAADPQKPAARFRLAQVLQAKREFVAAAAIYRQLVEARDPSDPSASAGVWADRSIVPLAQCLLNDGQPANDGEAERLLVSVVDGSVMSPEAPAYKDALIELGLMYQRSGNYPEAVRWMEQALRRYGGKGTGGAGDRAVEGVRYALADAHRLEAVQIARTLAAQRLPQAEADALEAQRGEHLRSARSLYGEVLRELDAREGRSMTNLEKIRLRNAHFYVGDCAMEMRDYAGAIAAYDAARLRYADDPASMVAMAQIVSAYAAQGRLDLARVANERAKQQLARFPESAWQNPDLPMEKRHWEAWLEARTLLEQPKTSAEGK